MPKRGPLRVRPCKMWRGINVVSWESKGLSSRRIRLNMIDNFDARGKRCVYGRGDLFPGSGAFHMEIWQDKTGRLLVRFWSRKMEADSESFELTGIIPEIIKKSSPVDEQWIPQILRKEYDKWILSYL